MENKWTKIEPTIVDRYLSPYEDEVIILNRVGDDEYVVVYDDAYEISRGTSFFGTKEEIEKKFNIEI